MRDSRANALVKTLEAAGHRLEYAWHGPPPDAAPTLVFLHEGLGCAAMWRDFPAELTERTGCGALVYSRLGYGGSDPVSLPRPLSYMHDEGFRVLPAVLDAAGVRRALLVGHSDGASIALLHAGTPAANPRVEGLLLEAPHVFVEDLSIESITRAREAWRTGHLQAALEKWHGANVEGAFLGWNGVWLDPGFRSWNIESSLPHIRAPVLVIQGADDEYGTVAQVDSIARQCGAPVRVEIFERCGHSPHRDQRERTMKVMGEFVEEQVRRRSPPPR
ncbi:MAG TPA: alpha/beta hydrolase [Myxococcaceae bacterium]|nr:alpha/beta hydrolase [Myxococcaceae bacterium]